MPIDFPNNPSVGNTYPYGNSIWEWTGSSWQLYGSLLPLPTDFTATENTFTKTQRFSQGITSSGGTFSNLSIVSSATSTSPLTITASSLSDGVGAIRINGVEPDMVFNDTNGGWNTFTFENAGDARVALGRDNGNDFYITVRDPAVSGGAWKDTTFVADSSSGNISMGYNLNVAGGGTFGSRVNFSNGMGLTGDILIHGATLGSRDGIAPKYFARAWVNFNGIGTISRRSFGNVSSIGDGGVGLYTVNFTVPMFDSNYSVCLTGKPAASGVMNACIRPGTYATVVTTTAVQISTYVPATTLTDSDLVSVIVFR